MSITRQLNLERSILLNICTKLHTQYIFNLKSHHLNVYILTMNVSLLEQETCTLHLIYPKRIESTQIKSLWIGTEICEIFINHNSKNHCGEICNNTNHIFFIICKNLSHCHGAILTWFCALHSLLCQELWTKGLWIRSRRWSAVTHSIDQHDTTYPIRKHL